MPIVIHDTLTAAKRELVPLDPGKIRFYACGPTVYDLSHVGHARSYVVWDVVVRHLRARGYTVTYVRNFTDVDDKIIRRANERGEDPVALADRFARAYDEDMDALGNLRPDAAPRVSEHVPQIVAMIETLVAKGFAYPATNGDVYYAVRKFPDYGRLAKRNLDDLLSGARVEPGEAKRDPLDFAHHTNEIAQSVAAYGDGRTAETFSRYWMHHGFVEIDSEKMSKSLGNFFTIREVLAKFDAEVMRLFLLGTHYRNPINYSDFVLQEAERRLRYLYKTLDKVDQLAAGASPAGQGGAMVEDARRALDDDFNTPQVLAVLAEAFTAANVLADKRGKKAPDERAALAAFARDAREIGTTLGLLQRPPATALRAIREKAAARRVIDGAEVEARIAERAAARKAKDFARGDAIRDALLAQGVALLDGPDGTGWDVE